MLFTEGGGRKREPWCGAKNIKRGSPAQWKRRYGEGENGAKDILPKGENKYRLSGQGGKGGQTRYRRGGRVNKVWREGSEKTVAGTGEKETPVRGKEKKPGEHTWEVGQGHIPGPEGRVKKPQQMC